MGTFRNYRDTYVDMAPIIAELDSRQSIDAVITDEKQKTHEESLLSYLDNLWEGSQSQNYMHELADDLGTWQESIKSYPAYNSHGYPGFGIIIPRTLRMGARYRDVRHVPARDAEAPYGAVRGSIVMYRKNEEQISESGFFALLVEPKNTSEPTFLTYGNLDAVTWRHEGSKLALEYGLTNEKDKPEKVPKAQLQPLLNSLLGIYVQDRKIIKDIVMNGLLLQNKSPIANGPDDDLAALIEHMRSFFTHTYEPQKANKDVREDAAEVALVANTVHAFTSGDMAIVSEFDVAKTAILRKQKLGNEINPRTTRFIPPDEISLASKAKWQSWLPSIVDYPELKEFKAKVNARHKLAEEKSTQINKELRNISRLLNTMNLDEEAVMGYVDWWSQQFPHPKLTADNSHFPFD